MIYDLDDDQSGGDKELVVEIDAGKAANVAIESIIGGIATGIVVKKLVDK